MPTILNTMQNKKNVYSKYLLWLEIVIIIIIARIFVFICFKWLLHNGIFKHHIVIMMWSTSMVYQNNLQFISEIFAKNSLASAMAINLSYGWYSFNLYIVHLLTVINLITNIWSMLLLHSFYGVYRECRWVALSLDEFRRCHCTAC